MFVQRGESLCPFFLIVQAEFHLTLIRCHFHTVSPSPCRYCTPDSSVSAAGFGFRAPSEKANFQCLAKEYCVPYMLLKTDSNLGQ